MKELIIVRCIIDDVKFNILDIYPAKIQGYIRDGIALRSRQVVEEVYVCKKHYDELMVNQPKETN